MFFKAGTGVIGLLIYAVLITIIATLLIARAILTEPPVQDVRIVEDTTRKFYLVYLLQTALFTLEKPIKILEYYFSCYGQIRNTLLVYVLSRCVVK